MVDGLHNRISKICEEREVTFFGIADLGREPSFKHYENWIASKKHGDMKFLEKNNGFRENPAKLEPGLNKALVLGYSYYQGDRYAGPKTIGLPRVAQYARFSDYHKLLKKKANLIIDSLKLELRRESFTYRVIVDSAPVLERALAAKTGGGFIGKNTLFISSEAGSFFLLFEILVDIDLPASDRDISINSKRPDRGECGTCRRCSVHCPTDALSEQYILDATKCIAYYTIEHRGLIPVEFWDYLKLYYFGCDICQLVCPHNRNAKIADDLKKRIPEQLDLFDVAVMNQDDYVRWFGGTPMTRAKIGGLKRNALIYLVVSNDKRLPVAIDELQNYSATLSGTIQQISSYHLLSRDQKSKTSTPKADQIWTQ